MSQSTTLVANFATDTTGVLIPVAIFATGVNDTGGNFALGVNDTGCKYSNRNHIRLLTP
jgi:hypothetical protein